MPRLQNIIAEIESLSLALEKLKPLNKRDEDRLWKKFRLEWNYNSNHIEGNTLTYGQTELLLIFDKTTGDHEMREFEEMKAHDVIVNLVRNYASDKTRELSEADIRQWNKTILVRPFWTNAQTQDKQPTRKLVTPGEYKKEPNSVLLSNGEMFYYASPEETPIKMQELIDWYRNVTVEKELHSVEIAALLHYKFVCIHPFDDSNGRTSRLLMNYVLFRNDLPPVIIKSADKKNYLNALNKADVGDVNAFVQYIAEQLMWSLKISLSAAKGESIEEHDDLDKELDILTRELNSDIDSPVKSLTLITDLLDTSIRDFINIYFDKLIKLTKLIASIQIDVICNKDNIGVFDQRFHFDSPLKFKEINEFIVKFFCNQNHSINSQSYEEVQMDIEFLGIKKDLSIVFGNSIKIEFLFYSYFYEIKCSEFNIKKLYSQRLSSDQISKAVNALYRNTFELAKESIERNKHPRPG